MNSATELMELIRFNCEDDIEQYPRRVAYEERFIKVIERYFSGEGSPAGAAFSGFYTQTCLDPTAPMFRARLFLSAVTGTDIPPPVVDPPPICVSAIITHITTSAAPSNVSSSRFDLSIPPHIRASLTCRPPYVAADGYHPITQI